MMLHYIHHHVRPSASPDVQPDTPRRLPLCLIMFRQLQVHHVRTMNPCFKANLLEMRIKTVALGTC